MDCSQIESILTQLTLEEKLSLLGGCRMNHRPPPDGGFPGVERIHLPALKLADGPLGIHWFTDSSTAYPATIALAATFDEALAYQAGAAIGTDCRAAGVHVLLAPGVNQYRSPLCGRNFEYLGEDPELSGILSAAYIRGVQNQNVAATVKHFVANNQEYDRHRISSDIDERTLREVYLRPFEIVVKEGRSACLMTSYNLLNGQHTSECKWLITDLLRDEWGFEGLVMSDWFSVYSTAQTMNAGMDVEMPTPLYLTAEKLLPLIESGVISNQCIDDKIRRRLRLMQRFGWLDPAHEQKDETLPARNLETEEAALNIARSGCVLLKNEDGFLPALPEKVRRITLLGYHAVHPVISGGGSAYPQPHEAITLKQAIDQLYGAVAEINTFEMISLVRSPKLWTTSRFLTESGAPGLSGEYFKNNRFEGPPARVRTDKHIHFNWLNHAPPVLCNGLYSVRWRGYVEIPEAETYHFYVGVDNGSIDVHIDGIPIDVTRAGEPVVLKMDAGRHPIRIDFKKNKPDRSIIHLGYEPARAARVDYEKGLAAAKESDLVIVATGFVEDTEFENGDRSFALDPRLNQMILDVSAVNPNTMVALYSGGGVDVAPWIDQVKALLCLWYPGQNGTVAAAEIISGRTNPSGRLPFTWEHRLEDRGSFPFYHDEDRDSRTAYNDGVFTGYRWFDKNGIVPRWPFGFGLSYTEFNYVGLAVDPIIDPSSEIRIQFNIVNAGFCSGAATAMIFVSDPQASVPRPIKELKAVKKVFLTPGEHKTVHCTLSPRAFAFWDTDKNQWVVESGTFEISIGENATTLHLRAETKAPDTFTLHEHPCAEKRNDSP